MGKVQLVSDLSVYHSSVLSSEDSGKTYSLIVVSEDGNGVEIDLGVISEHLDMYGMKIVDKTPIILPNPLPDPLPDPLPNNRMTKFLVGLYSLYEVFKTGYRDLVKSVKGEKNNG